MKVEFLYSILKDDKSYLSRDFEIGTGCHQILGWFYFLLVWSRYPFQWEVAIVDAENIYYAASTRVRQFCSDQAPGHCGFKPRLGLGQIFPRETKCIAVMYDACSF